MPLTIGQRTKNFREQSGMTVAEASELSGISVDRFMLIEADATTPTAGQVLGISWALGVPFDTVRGESEIRDRAVFMVHTTADAIARDKAAISTVEAADTEPTS
jgi:transcriptional regulator with XRE-family HTH domain